MIPWATMGLAIYFYYDSEKRKGAMINPIHDACCYRDARWNPDGSYIHFLFRIGTTSGTK
jgi:hypothetical protein